MLHSGFIIITFTTTWVLLLYINKYHHALLLSFQLIHPSLYALHQFHAWYPQHKLCFFSILTKLLHYPVAIFFFTCIFFILHNFVLLQSMAFLFLILTRMLFLSALLFSLCLIPRKQIMEDLPFSSTFMSVTSNFIPTNELRWLPSVFSGIIMCNVVYKLTGYICHLCFGGYSKLSDAKKIEWNNRGFSTFHAVVVAAASVYLLLFSNLFDENSQDELIVNRSSTLSNSILGISIGYFVSDLAMILWHFPALGGMEYVLHHVLSLLSVCLSLLSGQAQLYILMILFSESTTPFVNLRWYLDVAGLKNSKAYVLNGFLLFLGWLVARIILFIFFFTHLIIHFDQVKEVFPLGFYALLSVPPTLAVMNLIWFWKIVKGLIKTLSKAKHKQ